MKQSEIEIGIGIEIEFTDFGAGVGSYPIKL
jgi:hypothetical protein